MLPHQERVIEERDQLLNRLKKLHNFFDTPIFSILSTDEQSRLEKQSEIMLDYLNILNERITNF